MLAICLKAYAIPESELSDLCHTRISQTSQHPSCLGLPSTIEVAVINQCRATMSLGEGLGYLHCIYLALSCTSALSVAILVWLLGLL